MRDPKTQSVDARRANRDIVAMFRQDELRALCEEPATLINKENEEFVSHLVDEYRTKPLQS